MNVLYSKSFNRDLDAIQNRSAVKKRLLNLIEQIKKVDALSDISGVKKIKGYPHYFRIRLGDYRLGIKAGDNEITMIRFLHRKDIYRRFP